MNDLDRRATGTMHQSIDDIGPVAHTFGTARKPGLVYASLPAVHDLFYFRIGGAGIGNCFFAYFHAVLLAARTGQRIIAPAWSNVSIGVLLRGEYSRRRYSTMFVAHPNELTGIAKAWALLRHWRTRRTTLAAHDETPAIPPPGVGLDIVTLGDCRFGELVHHRQLVRDRLLKVMATPPVIPAWGALPYIAVHIRLGDFAPASDPTNPVAVNTRIPMRWYVAAIAHARALRPHLPVRLFSDGYEHELADLLALDGVSLDRSGSDIDQLIAMASASLFVGSNSTFSYWAAFLGNMPTLWARPPAERLTSTTIPIMILDSP